MANPVTTDALRMAGEGPLDSDGATPSGLRVPVRLWFVILAGCLVAGVLDASQVALRGVVLGDGEVDVPSVIWQASEWLILAGLTPLIFFLGQRFPLRRGSYRTALVVHLAGALLLCVCWATLGVVLRRQLGRGWTESFWEELGGWMLFSLPWSVFLYFALLGTVHAFSYYIEARDRQMHALQLSSQLSESRLRALRAQLQPHFLFNTLNAITVLVRDTRTVIAVQMLDRLSELLRQLLRADETHEISVASELHLARQYLAIEEVRFADRLKVTYRVDENTLASAVPSFVLQPLVENALRHGLGGSGDVVRIEIGARHEGDVVLVLWVSDSGPGLRADATPGVGLENIRERLRTLYGSRAELVLSSQPGGGTRAEIRLPFRAASERPPGPAAGP